MQGKNDDGGGESGHPDSIAMARLHLSIAQDHLQLDLLQPNPVPSWTLKCRRLWAYLNGDDRDFYSVKVSETSSTQTSNLVKTLEQLTGAMQRNSHKPLKGAVLEVEVGGGNARMGLLDINAEHALQITPNELSLYVRVWVKHTWAWDADDCIIQSTPSSHAGRYVVTAVRKSLVEALTDASERLGLRLSVCKPAMVMQLATLVQPTHPTIAIWRERRLDGTCSPRACLVAMDAGGLVSIHHVWAAESSEVLQESALTAWLPRIAAQLRWIAPIHTSTHDWPTAPGKELRRTVL